VGRESNRKKAKKFRERVLRLVGKKYSGEEGARCGPTLAAEHLASEDDVEVNAQTLRRWMLAAGLWSQARKQRVSYESTRGAITVIDRERFSMNVIDACSPVLDSYLLKELNSG
jgi:hypothetical protein